MDKINGNTLGPRIQRGLSASAGKSVGYGNNHVAMVYHIAVALHKAGIGKFFANAGNFVAIL